jgi:uncharacterized protein
VTSVYELRILDKISGVPRETWDALVAPDASPFVEHTFLQCLEDAGCVGPGTSWTPLHCTLYRDDKLVGAMPTYAKMGSEGEFVFDWGWADASERAGVPYYPKIIFAVPFTPATGHRALVLPGEDRETITKALAMAGRQWVKESGVSSAHVLFPQEAESKLWEAAGYATRLGIQFHWRRGTDTSWADFLARFNAKRRHALRREALQPEKDGVVIKTLAPEELTKSAVRDMYELYVSTVDKFFYGRRYLNPRFFELLAERWKERLAWVVAEKDGRTIAGAFNVQKGKVLYGRYWGTRVDMPFLHFNVCYYHGIKHCLEHGLDLFEPGAGGEHKRVRGFLPTVTYSNHWIEHPRLRRAISDFLARERDAVLEHVGGVETGRE